VARGTPLPMLYGRTCMRIAIALTCMIGVSMDVCASPEVRCCPVIELRQYTLKPGQRDTLINLFDQYFVESQEATGMTIVGQFRDRQRPDRFVWMRGFADMATRHRALERFYTGPVWSAHRMAANNTMIDSNDVLLLRPARPDAAFLIDTDAPAGRSTRVVAAIYQFDAPVDETHVTRLHTEILPRLQARGVVVQGVFVTETAPNTFTRLPVREGEHVLVWVGYVGGTDVSRQSLDELARISALDGNKSLPTMLDLEPTSRSWLGHGPRAARATKHDFDFLHGSWSIHNRYLKERLKGSSEWIEFEARSDVEPLLDGFGQIDRYSAMRDGSRVEGVTLRLFNPATGEWSLHWADTVRPGELLPPMVGHFKGDVGEFFGDEMADGKRVLCRFHWTRTADGLPRWEQAFSDDGGRTWETNWVMTFTRR
jgi:NIPSNAP